MANCIKSLISSIIPEPVVDATTKAAQEARLRAEQARIKVAKDEQLADLSVPGGVRSLIGSGSRAGFKSAIPAKPTQVV